MLEADVRQEHNPCTHDVGCVETAAEPRLHDGGTDAALRKVQQRGGGQRFELRRVHGLRDGANTCYRALERLGIGVQPLVPAAHVRRRVRADVETVRAEQCGDRPRGGRLAVRADDMHRSERPLRVPQRLEQRSHAPEAELLGPGRERCDPLRRRQLSRR